MTLAGTNQLFPSSLIPANICALQTKEHKHGAHQANAQTCHQEPPGCLDVS